MRILEVCTFSAGGCGVWARVKREAALLHKKGHNVQIFTTNREKGTWKKVPAHDAYEKVPITRFPAIKLGGESFMFWRFTKEARAFHPDLIIVHSYRHTHTTQALNIAKQLNCNIFLVTHAPFNREDTRTLPQKIAVWFYDALVGRHTLSKFDKVLAISKWEIPFLKKLGLKKENIIYSPNGLPEDFFQKPIKDGNPNIMAYTGRIAPIKNLELALQALTRTSNKHLSLRILGPAEPAYKKKLLTLIQSLNLEKRVTLKDQRFTTQEQIKYLESGAFFILPSHSEGMPQVLIEALARKRIVFASDILANRDIIKDKENGFLFDKNNPQELAHLLDTVLALNPKSKKKLKENAFKNVQQFRWNTLIDKLDALAQATGEKRNKRQNSQKHLEDMC